MLYVKTDYQQILDDNTGSIYITAGKFYAATEEPDFPGVYAIKDDSDYEIAVAVGRTSAHLNHVGIFELYSVKKVDPKYKSA